MDAINSISKPKLPKSYSYVLKSSQLDDLFKCTGITIHTDLVYWLPQKIGSILEVYYWLPNNNVPYSRLYVRAGALPKDNIQEARIIMYEEVLPKLGNWLEDIQKLDNHSFYGGKSLPYFNAVYKNNMAVEYVFRGVS